MLTVLYKSASRTPHRRAPGETGSAAGRCGGLQRRGAPIGATDTLIAAHARSQAAALVNSAARRCERGAGPAACRLGVNARHSPGRVRGGGQTRTDAVARKGTRGDPRVRGRRNIATIPEVTLGGAAMAAAVEDPLFDRVIDVPGKQHEDVDVGVVAVGTPGDRAEEHELHLRAEQRGQAELQVLKRCCCVLLHERRDLSVDCPADHTPTGFPLAAATTDPRWLPRPAANQATMQLPSER